MKNLSLRLLFILSLFAFYSCAGTYQYHVFDQNEYRGATGSINTTDPLHIEEIDGMGWAELRFEFNPEFTIGSYLSTYHLIPGMHTIEIRGGTSSDISSTTIITGPKIFELNIEENHFYKVKYQVVGEPSGFRTLSTLARIFIFDETAKEEVGRIIERKIHSVTAKPPEEDLTSVSLRSSYQALTKEEAKAMVKRFNFHDDFANRTGSGIYHQFESKTLGADKVVIDHTTGLMWHQSGSQESTAKFRITKWMQNLNIKRYAGFSDWRLPTLEEAASLIAHKQLDGSLYSDPVFSEKQTSAWSGDTFADTEYEGKLYSVYFQLGRISWIRCYVCYVRPVRSIK